MWVVCTNMCAWKFTCVSKDVIFYLLWYNKCTEAAIYAKKFFSVDLDQDPDPEKVDPGPLEKVDPISKFTVLVKDIFDKSKGADFKYDNSFFKF